MIYYSCQSDGYTFYVKQWNDQNFELVATFDNNEVWKYPNNIYRLADCSTHVRSFLKTKGKRIKWEEYTP